MLGLEMAQGTANEREHPIRVLAIQCYSLTWLSVHTLLLWNE